MAEWIDRWYSRVEASTIAGLIQAYIYKVYKAHILRVCLVLYGETEREPHLQFVSINILLFLRLGFALLLLLSNSQHTYIRMSLLMVIMYGAGAAVW